MSSKPIPKMTLKAWRKLYRDKFRTDNWVIVALLDEVDRLQRVETRLLCQVKYPAKDNSPVHNYVNK